MLVDGVGLNEPDGWHTVVGFGGGIGNLALAYSSMHPSCPFCMHLHILDIFTPSCTWPFRPLSPESAVKIHAGKSQPGC